MKKIQTALAIVLAFYLAPATAQQAWTKEKGAYYTQLGGSFLRSNRLLNGLADPLPLNRDITDITVQFYGEYGITNKITVSGQIPFKLLNAANTVGVEGVQDGSLSAFSNIQTAVTARLYNKNGYVVSAKTGLSLPTAKFQEKTGLRSGFDALSISPSLLAGLGHAKFFTSAEVGYVVRNNGYSNRVFATWQIGKYVGKQKKLLPILSLDYMKSLSGGTFNDESGATTGMYLNAQSYLSPGLKLGYKSTPKITLWLSFGGGVGNVTKNIAASPGLSFSISYQNK